MRNELIVRIKSQIETNLKGFLREEGIELYVAGNDNYTPLQFPAVELQAIENASLEGSKLLSEIKVILGILGKPWQCETLIDGIYQALHPHHITVCELTVLLMSLHVETMHCVRPRLQKKRAIMRYVIENNPCPSTETPQIAVTADAEYC